jgi:HEAT repeat protein
MEKFCRIAEGHGMSRIGSIMTVIILAGVLILPAHAFAQYGGGIAGPRLNGQPFSALEQAGPGSLHNHPTGEDALKDAKRKLSDADPRVRVEGLEKLRYVESADVTELLFRGLNDGDARVRIKAIDLLGARQVSDAVPLMTQALFLRETPAVEKLHLVAALGRIGDARGTLAVLDYLKQTDEVPSRGTAVFALGEIGDPRANDQLIQIVSNDQSPKVRKLAREALEKIDGELPSRREYEQEVKKEQQQEVPTDQKLAKMRAIDQENRKNAGY